MVDEMQRLRESAGLFRLLTHYVEAGAADREAWQDRRMHLEGATAQELVGLHGELLAYEWLDQNTGVTPALKPGAVCGCYRTTLAGRRALKRAQATRDADEPEAAAA